MKMDKKILEIIRKTTPEKVAEELNSVQSMEEAAKALGKIFEPFIKKDKENE